MKAIVTGFTSSMSTGRSQVGFDTLTNGIVRALTSDGHQVNMTPMRVETNDAMLAEADIMFWGLSPFNGLGSRYIYGAIDALMKARANNVGVVCYVSDWQTSQILTSARAMHKNPAAFVKPLMAHRTDYDWAKENIDYLMAAVGAFLNNPWPITLVPTHPWRDPNSILTKHVKAREIVHVDPTMWTTRTWPIPSSYRAPENREAEWVLAGLGDYTDWIQKQEFSWPVRYFGGKTFAGRGQAAVPEINEDGVQSLELPEPTTSVAVKNKRIKEAEVNENYGQVWGGLSPKYQLSGSGWWRTRYDFILRAGGILYGPTEELYPMGEPFRLKPSEIELMSTRQLTELQNEQAAGFQCESADVFLDKILGAARKAWIGANS